MVMYLWVGGRFLLKLGTLAILEVTVYADWKIKVMTALEERLVNTARL